jgi:hypothetical protein
MLVRWRSMSSSVARPAVTSWSRIWRIVADSRAAQAGEVSGKYASAAVGEVGASVG